MTTDVETPKTCTVMAPETLDAGYSFVVSVDNIEFEFTVPEGGVTKGQLMEVPYPSTNTATPATTAPSPPPPPPTKPNTAKPPVTVPTGAATAPPPPSPPVSKGPRKTNNKAIWSLILSICGLFLLGIVLGPIAICLASQAKKEIKDNPDQMTGDCQATSGMIIGIIGTVLSAIIIISLF